jgi:RNA polymerase sigma-70 factor (ECF subfamily)
MNAVGRAMADAAPADVALEAFVVSHYPRLIRLAGLICREPHEAQDAVQAGLERAWRHRSQLLDAARMQSWLDRIIVREAIRSSRGGFFAIGRARFVTEIQVEPRAAAGAGFADEWADLRTAFERLSAAQRAVVALHLYAGYPVAETAAIVGSPVETVRSRLRAAREALRASMGDKG